MGRDPIEDLRAFPVPPDDLEARILAAVTANGGIAPRRSWRHVGLRVAAAAVLVAAGVALGRTWPTAQVAPAIEWMLLLGGDVVPPVDGSNRAAEYAAWMQGLQARGITIRGAELADGAIVIAGEAGPEAMQPLAAVGGYFIFAAGSEEEAVALARSSPHAANGGTVVVRQLR